METENNKNQERNSITVKLPTTKEVASKRRLIPMLFVASLLFFFFNFFTVSCGKQDIASVKGVNLVFGKTIQTPGVSLFETSKDTYIPPNFWAIITYLSSIAGLSVFLYRKIKKEAMIGFILGGIGFVSLVILRFTASASMAKLLGSDSLEMIKLKLNMGYWFTGIALLAATTICYLRMKMKSDSPEVLDLQYAEQNECEELEKPECEIDTIVDVEQDECEIETIVDIEQEEDLIN